MPYNKKELIINAVLLQNKRGVVVSNLYYILPYLEDILNWEDSYFLKLSESESSGKDVLRQLKASIVLCVKEPSKIKTVFQKIGIKYSNKMVPFVNITSLLLSIKNRLNNKIVKDQKFKTLLPSVNLFFDNIISNLSKGYLVATAVSIIDEYSRYDLWKNQDYESIHIRWLIELSRYIIGDKKEPPQLNYRKCPLSKKLSDPYFRLKFTDDRLYRQITHIHRSIHDYTKSLVFYFESSKYMEAYFVLKSVIAESYRFLNDISNINFMYEMNREKIFFESIFKFAKDKTFYLIVITVSNSNIIRKFYGKETLDQTVDQIQKRLGEFLNRKKSTFIKGEAGEFYIICNSQIKDPKDFGRKLKTDLEKIRIGSELKIKLKISVGILEMKNSLESGEISKIIAHIIEKSKNSPEDILFYDHKKMAGEFAKEISEINKNISIIEEAFREKSIDLFFQPIIDIKTGKTAYLESLARIKKNGSYIPAGAFIDIIYDLNLEIQLDIEVLKKIHTYSDLIKKVTDTVFINVSSGSISSSHYIKIFLEEMKKINKKGLKVILELTEQSFLENMDLIRFLKENYDFSFAVDDFGTGYSSIRTVYDLSDIGAIRYLKIDGSMIKNLHKSDKNIKPVETIVSFAKTLNLKTVAEFVENEKIYLILKDIGIDYGQGYYYQKPEHIKKMV